MTFTTISQARREIGVSYLGAVNISSKLKKNGKISNQHTYALYLAPYDTSGYNVCQYSTKECRLGCLATSGRAGMEIICGSDRIVNARIKKTKTFYEQPELFMALLIAEIKANKIKAHNQSMGFSVRLNATSDIDWQNVRVNGQNIFEIFSDIQFYDYTKNPKKFNNLPTNYHLTFSYTGRNWNTCKSLLQRGYNVAMIFDAKKAMQLPTSYEGFVVINGDKTDYRVADSKGVIIGLKWKRIADRQAETKVLNSCFVVKTNEMILA